MLVFWIICALLVALIVLLIYRGAAFKPPAGHPATPEDVFIDEASAVAHMQALIACPTVSYHDSEREDSDTFEKLIALLPTLYPRLHAACPLERIGPRGLLYHWKGKHSDAPSVFMAHFDVVPVHEDQWEKPPFAAMLEDGVLWGRGTLDTKGTLLGALEAAEKLIADGFTPENDIYLSFGGDEEIRGDSTPSIVEAFKTRGIVPAFVLDEGGAVVEHVFPGVKKPCALVGVGEKGSMDMTLTAKSRGGHASTPPPHTPVGVLARAITRVEDHPFPFRLSLPAGRMFDTLGRHSTLPYRILFANLWCFRPLLNLICKKTGGEMNALVRTTCAFTQMSGSDAPNVLPPEASVGANLRLVPGDTVQSAKARIERTIHNGAIEVSVTRGNDPSPLSDTTGEAWERLGSAIAKTWPEAILSPYLMVAASDAYHYSQICPHVYRFSAMALSSEERKLIHAHNERVPVQTLFTTIRFYVRLMRAC